MARWNPFRKRVLGSVVEETDQTDSQRVAGKSKTWGTTVDRVPSWPEEARPLKKHTWLTYLYGVGDFILVLLPLFFIRGCHKEPWKQRLTKIVLGIAVVTLNGKPTRNSAFGTKVEFTMDLVGIRTNCMVNLLI
jgi:hypothetical protein